MGKRGRNNSDSFGRQKYCGSSDDKKDNAVIYNAQTGEKLGECSFGTKTMDLLENDIFADPKDYIFQLSQTGTWLAVSFDDGSVSFMNWKEPEKNFEIYS